MPRKMGFRPNVFLSPLISTDGVFKIHPDADLVVQEVGPPEILRYAQDDRCA